MQRVVVVGAGIVGLACAARLRQRGHEVVVIDPLPPGEGCSLGNAGCLSRCSFVPLGLPGMWKNVPKWLFDPDGPLTIPARHALQVAPWAWRLLRSTSPADVERTADALFPLLDPSVRLWRPLAQWAGVPELIRQDGYGFAYESEAPFKGDAYGRALRAARGVGIEVLHGPAVREFEPALSPRVTHLVLFPDQGHVPDPLALSRALAARLRAEGTDFVTRSVRGFEMRDGRVARVLTDGDGVAADVVVVAAGARSNALSSQLGCPVLLESERGYHVMLAAPSVVPRIPIMSGEGKYFCTPMVGGLRVAGTVELAGLEAPPRYERVAPLIEGVRRLFPDLQCREGTRWMGHRPSLPDSKPIIGRAPAVANALFAFGHGHVGLTAAAPTAEIVADLVDDREPYMPIEAFAADRRAVRA